MHLLIRLVLPMFVLLFSGSPALAQKSGWTISEAKGSVLVIDTRGQRPATVGTEVDPGATIRTQARSAAVLVRGREFVTMRQNAQLRIPEAAQARGIVQILQDYGSALFNIGKQPNPHFGVDTPYLAAVVKGTTFVITVSGEGASLQVTEGAVEAATRDGGVRELIRPGAAAMIAAGDPLRMVIEGEGRRVLDSPARPATSPAATAPAPAAIEPAAHSDRGQARIERAVVSTPGDLGEYSRGFVSGEAAVLAAAVVADNTGRADNALVGASGGRGESNDSGNGGEQPSKGGGGEDGQGNGNRNGNGNGGGDSGPGNSNGGGEDGPGNGKGGDDEDGPGNGNGNGNGNDGGSEDGPGNGNGGDDGDENGPGNGRGDGEGDDDGKGDRGNGGGNQTSGGGAGEIGFDNRTELGSASDLGIRLNSHADYRRQ